MYLRQLTVAVVAVLVTTLSVQSTALGAHKKHPGTASTTTTTTAIPPAAEPLLKRLLATAGEIHAENARAAALSEVYDQQVIKLAAAKRLVAACDVRVAAAESRVEAAKLALRKAAVLAYVSDDTTAFNSPLLTNDASDGEMVAVYAGSVQNNLQAALARYLAIRETITSGRDEAVATERRIRLQVAELAGLRSKAIALMKKASRQYTAINKRLVRLLKLERFLKLFSGWPAGGARYTGKNLAGSLAPKPANALQALLAAATARKFLGVPYVWGGASKAGVDCSGLTMLAWAKAGVALEHSATMQWEESVPVPLDHLRAGDLLFYHFPDDGNTPITHVVMYLGSGPYGAATAIQAAMPGTNVAYTPVYLQGFVSAGEP